VRKQESLRKSRSGILLFVLILGMAVAALTGCGFSGSAVAFQSIYPPVALHGAVHGGQQPVSGSSVQLYAAGATGTGSAAQPLLRQPVHSDSNGNFSIPASYLCPSASSQLYLIARGGNPGPSSSTDNPGIALMAMLGACSNLSSTAPISVNEVTTVGSVWPLASYMTSPTDLGSPPEDAAFLSAAASVNEFINLSEGTSPGTPTAESYFAESSKLYSLADLLDNCVNSAGGSAGDGSPCGTLFSMATASGGSAPADTVSAAMRIAQSPYNNVIGIYGLTADPTAFQPELTSAPPDWTLTLTYPAAAPPAAPVATPSISLGTGTYVGSQEVTLSDSTIGSKIYYTTDGTIPTTASPPYSGAISITVSTTLQAIAALGQSQSAVAASRLTIAAPGSTGASVATPSISPETGTYAGPQEVTISDSTTGSKIYYTTDGTIPTTSSPVYAGAIPIAVSTTVQAIAALGQSQSAVASSRLTITTPAQPAAATQLAFLQQPSNALTQATISPPVTVRVLDQNGSLVSSATNAVSLHLATGSTTGSISGTLTRTAVNGVATFNDLSLSSLGQYTLQATSNGLSAATSAPFSITAPTTSAGSQLAFITQPSNSTVGYSMAPSIIVVAEDASGNPIDTSAVAVTLALNGNSGSTALKGTLTATTSAAGALFSNLSITQPGSGYTLTASSPGFASATSATFTISPAASGAVYYVSNSGNDSNNGISATTPWRSISKVNSSVLSPGSQVLFQSTGVWHEQLNAQSGIRYGAYGPQVNCSLSPLLVANCGNLPIIDGADAVEGWSAYSGATYRAPYTGTASKGFVDSLYSQTTPLGRTTSIAAVISTPGTIYSDGTYVYINLPDGSNPASHTIEVSGSRAYGIFVNGAANTVVDGLEVIRTAKSGYLNYAYTGTGASNIVQNTVFFNNGDSLSDPVVNGQIEGAILSAAGYRQTPVPGFIASNNWIGRLDVPHDTLNYTWSGIQVDGMAAPQITANKVATVNAWAVRVQDYFANACAAPLVVSNETVNSEGNIGIAGCLNAAVVFNSMHDSFGNAVQAGTGMRTTDLSTGLSLRYNNFTNIRPAYDEGLYNGIDINYVANGFAIGNTCSNVANDCMTLEADSAPSGGWTVTGNTFDASQNVYANDTAPTAEDRVYPFYIRNTSLAAGLTMQANTLIVNAVSPYIKYGATSGNDQTHDLTLPQFMVACPGCAITP
jgi:Chitobiase/beta-hexosaminidase C-terminal domain